jgi:hypothetical protein
MNQVLINEIQTAVGRLHDQMELEREQLNDALAAGRDPEEHLRGLANRGEDMNRLLEQHNQAMRSFWRGY